MRMRLFIRWELSEEKPCSWGLMLDWGRKEGKEWHYIPLAAAVAMKWDWYLGNGLYLGT